MINKVTLGNSEEILKTIKSSSVDLVLTDPPYFLDKMDNNWDHKEVSNITDYCNTIKSLPPGMKFDKEQGKKFYKWYLNISKELYRVLKPGGFFFTFASPRLYHRMASAVDDAGFLIRDCFMWLYTQNQPKAMSLNHFIERLDLGEANKKIIKDSMSGWKTPQVKSCFEPIVMAQKKVNKTFLNNMIKHKVGLINSNIKIGQNMFPANVVSTENIDPLLDKYFLLPKPSRKEKGEFNNHRTVKPLELCKYLIELTTFYKKAVVLDPFVGSGTTVIAAKELGRRFIGIDSNKEYVEIAMRRLENINRVEKSTYNTIQAEMPLFAY